MRLLKRYERIVKRKIRESKKFKKKSRVKIFCLNNNTSNFVIDLIKKLNEKFSLDIKLDIKKYNYIEEFKFENDSIVIINAETILGLFLIGDKRFIKEKTESYINLGYWISELELSKEIKTEAKKVFRNKEIEDFVYKILSINKKFPTSSIRFIKKYSEFF